MSFQGQLDLLNKVLKTQFSEDFIRKMKARMFVGFHRYGEVKQYAESKPYNRVDTIRKRLEAYEKTGNQEHLVDVANFVMMEYMNPTHPNAHFESVEEEDQTKRLGVVRDTEILLRFQDEDKKTLDGNPKQGQTL